MRYLIKVCSILFVTTFVFAACSGPSAQLDRLHDPSVKGRKNVGEIVAEIDYDSTARMLKLIVINKSRRRINLPIDHYYTSELWPNGYGELHKGARIHFDYYDACKPANDNERAFAVGIWYTPAVAESDQYKTLAPGDTIQYITDADAVVKLNNGEVTPSCLNVEAEYINYWESPKRRRAWIGKVYAGSIRLNQTQIHHLYNR